MINKNIAKFLVKDKGIKVAVPYSKIKTDEAAQNQQDLWKFSEMWERLRPFRRKRRYLYKMVNGEQWIDKVQVGCNEWITEEEHIRRQGKIPLKNNLMAGMITTVLGVFRNNHTEPQATSRTQENREAGDMMTCAVQYNYQTQDIWELDSKNLKEFCISGMACQLVRYTYQRRLKDFDVYVENINPTRCFFNNDIEDPRSNDIRTFGILEDLTVDEIVKRFARNKSDEMRLREIFDRCGRRYIMETYDAFTTERKDNLSFFESAEANKCRVIQVWELKSRERIRVWDKYAGEKFVTSSDKLQDIERENAQRTQDALSQGFTDEEIQNILMECRWFYEDYFRVRYYSPMGDILFESENPYEHGELPFEVVFDFSDGEIHSLAERMVDQQKYVNRLITLADFIMGASAKGVLVFPSDALGDMTKEEVMDEWTDYRGVIFAKLKPGMPMPTQIATNNTNIGIYELLNMQLKMMQDVSGITPALQGSQAKANTPASRYAMESTNAQVNLQELFGTYTSFRRRRDTKIMETIRQYYTDEKYCGVAGHEFTEAAKNYRRDVARSVLYDMNIQESLSNPVYRSEINNLLLTAMQNQQLNFKDMLRSGMYPFADSLLRQMEEAEQQQAQGQMQANPQAQAMLQQAIGYGEKSDVNAEAAGEDGGVDTATDNDIQ